MKVKGLLILLVIGIAVLFVILGRSTLAWELWNTYVLNNEDHFVSCEQLPSIDEVTKVVDLHKQLIQEIEAVNPNSIVISIGTSPFHYVNKTLNCSGKADLLITYSSKSDAERIKEIISTDRFFGIPYRMRNR